MDITFEHVSYTYQPKTPFAHDALDDLSFHIPSGTFVAIIGNTGLGKSTLIQHLNGLVSPTKGNVTNSELNLSRKKKPNNMKKLRNQYSIVLHYSVSTMLYIM